MQIARILVLFFASIAYADPLNDSLLGGYSTSHFQDAGSVFMNPAALAFQTDLNGKSITTSLFGSANRSTDGAFAFGLGIGYFGLGYERITTTAGNYNRYSLALAAPIHPTLYFGTRVGLTRSSIAAVGSQESLDFGIQYRPSRLWALGIQANHVNQPVVAGVSQPVQWVMSAIVRPLPRLDLTVDVDTLSNNFFKRVGYQVAAGYRIFDGFQARVGYHDTYKAQIGMEFAIEQAATSFLVQPSSRERTFLFGVHSSLKPWPSVIGPDRALLVELSDDLKEEPIEGSLFLPDRPSLWQKVSALEEAARREDIDTVILKIDEFQLGLGPASEIFDRVLALRKSGKDVIAYLDNAGIVEYLIACAASKVYIAPGSQLRFTGLAASHLFLKGTLDKIGVEAEVFARGKYKSMPEMFTRKESSPESKEVTFSLLKDLEADVVGKLTKSGRVNEAKWKELLSLALISSHEAVKMNLVDGMAEADTEIEKRKRTTLVREEISQRQDRLNVPRHIAIVHASGNILKGTNKFLGLGGAAMTPEGMAKRIRSAASDPRAAGIVVRVSSGGGEVGASYAIASLIEEAKKNKPVVVSMGAVAASGGYLISAPASRVFADASTLTGSIGVFLGKPNLSGLLKKIDLTTETLSTAPHAGLLGWDKPLTADGKAIMNRQLNRYYEDFTAYVGKHRNLSGDKVEKAAQGRVWSGSQAKGMGLVDEIGGLGEAVAYLAKQEDLGENPKVREVPLSRGTFEFFEPGGLLSAKAEESPWMLLLPEGWKETLPWVASLKENPFLLLTPVSKVD